MFLKLMGRAGDFRVIEVVDCAFYRSPEPMAVCEAGTPSEFTIKLEGNAYLLNSDGKTIEAFSVKPQLDRKTA